MSPRPILDEQVDERELLGRSRRRRGLGSAIRRLGWPLVEYVYELGTFGRFCGIVLRRLPSGFARLGLVWRNIYSLGTLSLPIILVSGLFIGLVLGLQFYTILSRYGQTELVGAAAALTLYRELGPVLAGLLFIGSACTAITAAIGLKRASEQIASMEVMAVDPIEREIVPRFLACIISLPLLTIVLLAVAIVGTYSMAVLQIGLDEGLFWSNIVQFARFFGDFTEGMIKSFVFAIAVALIALYHGYTAHPTAEGVARATTATVVYASLTLLGIDFFITAVLIKD